MRNWKPFLKEAIDQLADRGVTRIIGIPLAPQFSTLRVWSYFDAANAALPAGLTIDPVESFFDHPLLLDAFAERLCAAKPRSDEDGIFTAPSLPTRLITGGARYARE